MKGKASTTVEERRFSAAANGEYMGFSPGGTRTE
jgi:hypothetical protein